MKVAQSCPTLQLHRLYSPWNSPDQNTAVGTLSLLQGPSQSRDRTQISCIAGGFFNSWTTRETRTRVRRPFQHNSCLLPIPSDFSSLACLSQRAPWELGCPFSPWTPVPYMESGYSKGKSWMSEWMTEVIFKKHPDTLIPLETQKASCIWISFFIHNFIYFGWAGSSLRWGLFSSCRKQRLLSRGGVGFSLLGFRLRWSPHSRAPGWSGRGMRAQWLRLPGTGAQAQ